MLVLPFKGLYRLSQEFGVNPQNYSQFVVMYPDGIRRPMKGHNGLDFACPYRTEIIAPHDGNILEAQFDPPGYGNYIKVENDHEGSVLAHLDTIDVAPGSAVKQGDHLGWSDSTGNSTGNHLHWGYYTLPRDRNNGLAGFIDQTAELADSGILVKLDQLPVVGNLTPVLSEGEKIYKGIDLTNVASVRAAIDAWYDVANGKYVTVENYNDLTTRTQLMEQELLQVKDNNGNLVRMDAEYAQMKAAGYSTLDDVNKAVTAKDNELNGAKKQLVDVLKDNEDLHTMLGKKENQDYTVIEKGIEAVQQNKELQQAMTEITKAVGVEKPFIDDILSKVLFFKDIAQRALKKKESQDDAVNVASIQPSIPSIKVAFWESFLQSLSDSGKSEGVKT